MGSVLLRLRPMNIFVILLLLSSPEIFIQSSEAVIQDPREMVGEVLRTLEEVPPTSENKVNIGSIIDQLNEAMRLLNLSEQYESEGRIEEANVTARKSLSIVEEARQEAEALLSSNKLGVLKQNLVIWLLVPLISFLSSLLVIKEYEWYNEYKRRKLIRMRIRRRNKNG